MVVLTPTIAKGEKRKAQCDFEKGKGKKRKGESSSAPALERNTLYFAEESKLSWIDL